MSTNSVVKIRRAAVAAVAGVAAALSLSAGTAEASTPPGLVVDGFYAQAAGAFDLYATGLVNIAPTPSAACSDEGPLADHGRLANLNLGVAVAKLLTARCKLAYPTSTAVSQIANVSLLGGAITATGIVSKCKDNEDGRANVNSTVLTLNGNTVPLNSPPIVIPGVATVYINKNVDDGFSISTRAIEVVVDPIVVAGHVVVPGQLIDVGGCFITRGNLD